MKKKVFSFSRVMALSLFMSPVISILSVITLSISPSYAGGNKTVTFKDTIRVRPISVIESAGGYKQFDPAEDHQNGQSDFTGKLDGNKTSNTSLSLEGKAAFDEEKKKIKASHESELEKLKTRIIIEYKQPDQNEVADEAAVRISLAGKAVFDEEKEKIEASQESQIKKLESKINSEYKKPGQNEYKIPPLDEVGVLKKRHTRIYEEADEQIRNLKKSFEFIRKEFTIVRDYCASYKKGMVDLHKKLGSMSVSEANSFKEEHKEKLEEFTNGLDQEKKNLKELWKTRKTIHKEVRRLEAIKGKNAVVVSKEKDAIVVRQLSEIERTENKRDGSCAIQ